MPIRLHPHPSLAPPAAVVRAAAERGAGHAGLGAAAFVAPLLLNLALSLGDNEEVCYCLKVGWCGAPGLGLINEGWGVGGAAASRRVKVGRAQPLQHW